MAGDGGFPRFRNTSCVVRCAWDGPNLRRQPFGDTRSTAGSALTWDKRRGRRWGHFEMGWLMRGYIKRGLLEECGFAIEG